MDIRSELFEDKLVTDISARYDQSVVEFTLHEVDTFEDKEESFHATFRNPNGFTSTIRLFKTGLRALSVHQRTQRYRTDLFEGTTRESPASPPQRSTGPLAPTRRPSPAPAPPNGSE